MRILRRLVAFASLLLTFAVAFAGLEAYLAASGRSVFLLRALVGRLGGIVAGQQIERMELKIRVSPGTRTLSGTARLTVRSGLAERRRFYFLLNDGLGVQEAWQERDDGTRVPLPCYRLWLVGVLELPGPLGANQEARIGIRYAGEPRATGLGSTGAVRDGDVVLNTSDFWYPADLQGFISADVEVTLPKGMTLVQSGRVVADRTAGASRTVGWTTPRPVVGLALVAGHYRTVETERQAIRYRVYLPNGADLDGERILSHLTASDAYLQSIWGPAGFPEIGIFVHRGLARAFHDGSGVIGVPLAELRDGHYGFATIAHEAAHGWWGGTVAERWLDPGSGGEWIVEGFAELSSWLALENTLGEAALLRLIEERAYNPNHAAALSDLSAIDNAVDPATREIIYGKGGYVARLLRERLGAEPFDTAARSFLDRFRHRAASDRELQRSFEESSGQDLGEFFAAWVRGTGSLDLALDPEGGGALLANHGTAPPPSEIDLWRFPPSAEPEKQTLAAAATTPLGNAERLVLDPLGRTPDMMRANNVLPRRTNPRIVRRSARRDMMVLYGEPHRWSPANVVILDGSGRTRQSWHFDAGIVSEPVWSADGTRVLVGEENRGRQVLLALNGSDGSRERLADLLPASASADALFLARGDRLVRASAEGERTLVRHPNAHLESPLASPDGSQVAYARVERGDMDLRAVGSNGAEDRLLLAWRAPGVRWCWSANGAAIYAVIAGDWDWQLWELPVANGEPRALVREAARIADVAVEPGGTRVALAATASLEAGARSEIFVIEPASGAVERFNLGGSDALALAWLDAESLAVVTSDPSFPTLPEQRDLRRLRFADGSLLDYP